MPFVFRHNIIFIDIRRHYFHVNVFSDSVMIKVDIFMHMYISAHCDVCTFWYNIYDLLHISCIVVYMLIIVCAETCILSEC